MSKRKSKPKSQSKIDEAEFSSRNAKLTLFAFGIGPCVALGLYLVDKFFD